MDFNKALEKAEKTDFNAALNERAGMLSRPISVPQRGASFGSLAESAVADDPETRMRILAGNRFPDLSEEESAGRYRMTDRGPAYLADDGQWYLSEPEGFGQGVKQFAANVVGSPEPMLGSGIGAFAGTMAGGPAGGMLGAGLGGAAGQALRKLRANLGYDEPQTPMGNVQAMGTEAGISMAGEGAGQLVGKYLTRKSLKDVDTLDLKKIASLTEKARKSGIQLTPAEITGLRDLVNRQALLRDLPASATIMEDFLKMRNKDIQRAIYKFLGDVSTETTPHMAYAKGIKAAKGARDELIKKRKDVADVLYGEARPEPADIGDVIVELDEMIPEFKGTSIGGKLGRIRKALEEKYTAGAVHNVKEDVDDMIKVAVRNGQSHLAGELEKVKITLLDTLETQVPAYQTARLTFAQMSKPINELDDSLAGEVLKQAQKISPDLSRVLFGETSSPQAIMQAKKVISGFDPAAWDGVVRGYMQQLFENIAESSVSEAGNIGGVFRKKLIGSISKKSMMKNALSDRQYQAMNDLLDVLKATGAAAKGQSITAQRTEMIEEMTDEAMMGIKKTARVFDWSSILKDFERRRLGQYAEKLARIMTDPEGMTKLRKQVKLLKTIDPKTQASLNALGAAWASILGAQSD